MTKRIKEIDRRKFLKVLGAGAVVACSCEYLHGSEKAVIQETQKAEETTANAVELPKVFMTKDITPAGMLAVYKALGREATGKVAVKVSTGEPGGHHFLSPDLIKDLVQSVNGTIVECNTAYGGRRANTAQHKQAAADHGFTAIAPVDIMDEDGSISLPVTNGRNIKENFAGSHFANYDSFLVLSHFKGHAMAGFGGALKNISIGIASTQGKCWIHTGGNSKTSPWGGNQTAFLQSMAEASESVMTSLGEKILFINVMNNLSIDCDCDSNPARPEIADIGILASLDPVALDKACVDLVYNAEGSASLCRRIEQQDGMRLLAHAETIGLGSQQYELKSLDNDTGIIPVENNLYKIYLSPSGDNLYVSGEFNRLTLFNINGAAVASTKENTMNVSSLVSGIYLCQISSSKYGAITRKIWKK